MFFKTATSLGLVAALALTPAKPAEADAGELIGGLIIGGIIASAIASGNQRSSGGQTTRAARPSIPATEQGRQTQTALNYFGFNAGTVDGQVGPGTRAAIERYQLAMGFPVNGREFTPDQYDFLSSAYTWATAGGANQTGLANTSLLYAYRDSVLNTAPVVAGGPRAPATMVAMPQNGSDSAAPTVPNFFANAAATPAVSLASTCNSVMLQSSTNGVMTLANVTTDPELVLSEQFCIARTYAISDGERMMRSITGFTPDQIAAQCQAFMGLLADPIDQVSIVGQDEVLTQVRSFANDSGSQPAELAANARVCLSVGYARDDMRMAVGSSLVLTALGEPAYGELVGHHLREGFGTTTRPDLALDWYDASMSALETGARPAFMPGQPERTLLVRTAVNELGGPAPEMVPVPAALPSFSVQQQ